MSNMFALLESDDEVDPPHVPKKEKSADKAGATTKKSLDNKTKTTALSGVVVEDAAVRAEKGGRGGSGGRGRGGGRGGRGSKHKEGEVVPRKREYERRSGTGRGKEVSKGGAGGRNWGNPKTEAEEAEKAPLRDDDLAVADNAAEEGVEAVEANEPPPAPEPPVFTLDEYMATRSSARANSELFGAVSVRQVEADFSGMKTKDDTIAGSEFAAMGSAKTAKQRSKEQRAVAAKGAAVTDLGFKAPPPPEREDRPPRRENREGGGRGEGRGRGGRGGRGEGRGEGRGGRGGSRGGRGAARVDITDANAFPSL